MIIIKLSSILMVCSGIINIGIAGIFYYFTLISYLDNWLYGAGWQIVIGAMFTIVSIGTFRGSRNLNTKSTVSDIVLMMVALGELFFSLPFLSFAFAGEHTSLLEYGIPLLLASILLLAGITLRWMERKHRKMEEQTPRKS